VQYLNKSFSVKVSNPFAKSCSNCKNKNTKICTECTHGYTRWEKINEKKKKV